MKYLQYEWVCCPDKITPQYFSMILEDMSTISDIYFKRNKESFLVCIQFLSVFPLLMFINDIMIFFLVSLSMVSVVAYFSVLLCFCLYMGNLSSVDSVLCIDMQLLLFCYQQPQAYFTLYCIKLL